MRDNIYKLRRVTNCVGRKNVCIYSVFPRSVKFFVLCKKNMDFRQFNFCLLRAYMHHTPTHVRWSCGKIFTLSSKRTKRTNFRTDGKKTLYGISLLLGEGEESEGQ